MVKLKAILNVMFLSRDAWKSLGKMTKEDAMKEYIEIVTHLFPQWQKKVLVLLVNISIIFIISFGKLVFK